MEIKELKDSILKSNIPNLLVFKVEEPVLARQFINQMSTTLNKYPKYYDKADEVLYEIKTNIKSDFLYIILNDPLVLKNPEYLKELNSPERNIIVYYTELDSKSGFYKNNKDLIVDFKHLTKPTIIAYIMTVLQKNKITIQQEQAEQLVDKCNCNYSLCCNEIEKIITLGQANSNLVMNYMLENGFSDYRHTNMFSFVQGILNKDIKVFDSKNRLDDSVISLLYTLYKQTKDRLQATNGMDARLVDIMQLCSKIDAGIKDATLNADYALDYLLLRVFYEE